MKTLYGRGIALLVDASGRRLDIRHVGTDACDDHNRRPIGKLVYRRKFAVSAGEHRILIKGGPGNLNCAEQKVTANPGETKIVRCPP